MSVTLNRWLKKTMIARLALSRIIEVKPSPWQTDAWHLANNPSVTKVAEGFAEMDGRLIAHYIVYDVEEGWIDITAPAYFYDSSQMVFIGVSHSEDVQTFPAGTSYKRLFQLKKKYRKAMPFLLRWFSEC